MTLRGSGLLVVCLLGVSASAAQDLEVESRARTLAPAAVLQLPEGTSSALLADVDGNRLLLFERDEDGVLRVAHESYVAIGKAGAGKRLEGDEKTPIGIYHVTRYISGIELPPIYGAGALPVNYPNAWDRLLGRTGSGIWLHGTDKDDATLMPRSSRGCLTVLDGDFRRILSAVSVGATPVVVDHGVRWEATDSVEAMRHGVIDAIEQWRRDWESRDPELYLRHYGEDFRSDGMGYAAWAAHKTRVNRAKTFIEVGIDGLGLYLYPGRGDTVLATFRQTYRSNDYARERFKHQYWRRMAGVWRIVWEGSP